MNKFADAIVGGWSLAAVFRWDSGYPFDGYYDATGWQTNWNIRSYMTNIRKVKSGTFYNSASSTCTSGCDIPNMFANPDDANAAFRTPHPGETGSRNPLRFSPSINLDASLSKSFDMPWREGHKVTFRWDVFNVANTPYFTGQSIGTLGYTGTQADGAFGRYTAMANSPRIMQFALRYDF